jgi:DNA-binding protein YbaB
MDNNIVSVKVKLNNVTFDFKDADCEISDWNMDEIESHYEDKIVEVEVENDPEYLQDYVIEAVTDHLVHVSGWCVDDYDYAIVSVC